MPETLTSGRDGFTLHRMADKQGYYWDHEQCGWVRCATAPQPVEIPEQPTGPERTGIAVEQEADVRSG